MLVWKRAIGSELNGQYSSSKIFSELRYVDKMH